MERPGWEWPLNGTDFRNPHVRRGLRRAGDPLPGDVAERGGSQGWAAHGPLAVTGFVDLGPSDAGLRGSSIVTSKPVYHTNGVVPVSPGDEFLDAMSRIQQLDQGLGIFAVRLAAASDKLSAASKDG